MEFFSQDTFIFQMGTVCAEAGDGIWLPLLTIRPWRFNIETLRDGSHYFVFVVLGHRLRVNVNKNETHECSATQNHNHVCASNAFVHCVLMAVFLL